MPSYCLFCETQKCVTIARIIEQSWNIPCISPQIIQRKWVKGLPQEVHHAMLPGYIFLYPEKPLDKKIRIQGIIRVLGNGELQDTDLAFANMLKASNGVIGTIRLAEEGDRCIVKDPLWQKMEGSVVKVDRGRKRCCVEFVFDNVRRTVWLGYDIIQPVQTERLTITEPDMKDG